MILVSLFPGEFGMQLRYHVPWFHGLPYQQKAVEIIEGQEALYPSATEFRVKPPDTIRDDDRRGLSGWGSLPPDDTLRFFKPEPHKQQMVYADVVICPRWRRYGASKNWKGWPRLAWLLKMDGHRVFGAGQPATTIYTDSDGCWNYKRYLDASIEAMLSARLVISTLSGMAVLAVLCGRPLLLVTYGEKVAPGPVVDANGLVMEAEYGPAQEIIDELLTPVNHLDSPISVVDGWEDPGRVNKRARDLLTVDV